MQKDLRGRLVLPCEGQKQICDVPYGSRYMKPMTINTNMVRGIRYFAIHMTY